MRGIDTQVRKTRRAIFREVANMAYHSENIVDDMEALPYKLVDAENSPYWDNIYREREIVPVRGNEDGASKLAEMVSCINRSEVPDTEVLSNHVYRYCRQSRQIELAA